MQKLCEYGCGEEGEYQFGNGKWCCSESTNSCPGMKKKNSEAQPYNDPIKKAEIVKKIGDVLEERYGVRSALHCPEIKEKYVNTIFERYGGSSPANDPKVVQKMKATTLERFGVENPSQAEEIKEKKIQTSLEHFGIEFHTQDPTVIAKRKATLLKNFGVEFPALNKEILDRQRVTRIENGFEMDPMLQDEFKLYRQIVSRLSNQNYRKYQHLINPTNIKRSVENHLDHIYSVYDGFEHNIPPYIVSHWSNLQLLSRIDNASKGPRSDKSKEQLFEDFEKSTEAPFSLDVPFEEFIHNSRSITVESYEV